MDTADALGGNNPESLADRFARRMAVTVQPPKDFKVTRQGAMLRLTVIDRGKFDGQMEPSGATQYQFFWAETVDTSTATKIDEGLARATKVADTQRTWIEDRAITVEINDPKYQNGYFYVLGVNVIGDRSRYLFSGQQSNVVLDETIPDDVTHFQASESGRDMNGTVVSAISFKYRAPVSRSFAGVQWFLEHYPVHGMVTEFVSDRYFGAPGGWSQNDFFAESCRRKGVGTITLTNGSTAVSGVGTTFLGMFFPGDAVEIFSDQQGIVQSVTDDTHMTLTVNWTGTSTSTTDYTAIGLVNVYAVAYSKAGTHRDDFRSAPVVALLFDAELSAPIAPTLTGVPIGNGIRLAITPPPGTQLKHGLIYKGKGAGLAITDALMKTLNPIPPDVNNPFGIFQFDDVDFTTYEKENGQIYSYYATYVNKRGTEGPPTARLEVSPRLDSPGDNGSTQAAGAVTTNLLFDSFIYGTVGATVSAAGAAGLSQELYQGVPPAGAYHWDAVTGGGTLAGHQNSNQVILPAPGTGNWTQLKQRIDAWDNATTANRRIDKGRNITLAYYSSSTSPTPPNGSLVVQLVMINAGGADIGYYQTKLRVSTDLFDYTEIVRGSAGIYGHTFAGSLLTQNAQVLFVTFSPQTIPAAVDHLELRMTHWDTNNGNNLLIERVMLNYGDQWGAWTPEMSTTPFPAPGGTIPGPFPDRDGTRRGFLDTP
jgi:hypothetical protein